MPGVPVRHLMCVASVSVALLVLTACGSSSSSNTSSSAINNVSSSAGNGSPAGLVRKVAKGKPITVGFFDQDSGPSANPLVGSAEKAAVNYINNYEGGINGRPLKVSACNSDGTPETDIACTNNYVSGHNVVAILDGMDIADGAVLSTLKSANIPLFGWVAQNPQTDLNTNIVYYTGPANAAYAIQPFEAFHDAGHKTVVLAAEQNAAQQGYVNQDLIPAAHDFGETFTPVYFDPTSPNFSVIAATIVSHHPDVAGADNLPNENQNAELLQALRNAGYTGAFDASAIGFLSTVPQSELQGGVYVTASTWMPQTASYAPKTIQARLRTAEAMLRMSGVTDATTPETDTIANYNMWMNFADVLRTIKGPITNSVVHSKLANLRNFPGYLGPSFTCDHHEPWPGTSACSNQMAVMEAQANGSVKPLGPGGFLATPERLVVSSYGGCKTKSGPCVRKG